MELLRTGFVTVVIASALVARAAPAQEVPRRASGLWQIAVTVSGQPTPSPGQYCIDGATDDLALTAGGGLPQKDCSEARVIPVAGGFLIESVCKLGNSTVTSRGEFKGDLAASYAGDLEAKYSPPLYGRREVKSRIEGRLLGPCGQ